MPPLRRGVLLSSYLLDPVAVLQAAGADLPNRQGVVEAAPAAPMLRLNTEQRQRWDGAGRQQGVAQLEEGILPPTEGGIRRGAEASKRGKGIHVVQFGTYRRRAEGRAPHEVKSQAKLTF